MLDSDDRNKRRDAAHELADYGPGAEKALNGLIAAIEDRDIQIWHDATQALARLGPKAAPALDALMEDIKTSIDEVINQPGAKVHRYKLDDAEAKDFAEAVGDAVKVAVTGVIAKKAADWVGKIRS